MDPNQPDIYADLNLIQQPDITRMQLEAEHSGLGKRLHFYSIIVNLFVY